MSVHSQSHEDKGLWCPEPQCQGKQFKTAIALASHRNHCHTAEYLKFGKVRAGQKVFLTPSKISPSLILVSNDSIVSPEIRKDQDLFMHMNEFHVSTGLDASMKGNYHNSTHRVSST